MENGEALGKERGREGGGRMWTVEVYKTVNAHTCLVSLMRPQVLGAANLKEKDCCVILLHLISLLCFQAMGKKRSLCDESSGSLTELSL